MNKDTLHELKLLPEHIREISRNSGKTWAGILLDFMLLRFKKSLEFNEYYKYELEKADARFIDDYLGTKKKLEYLAVLNPRKYYILARNKFLANNLMNALGIPTARLLFYYNPEAGGSFANLLNHADQVEEFLKENDIRSFFYKTTESSQGEGIGKIARVSQEEGRLILHSPTGMSLRVPDVFAGDPLVVEEPVEQTQQLNALNPDSVNTLRVMTALYPDGRVNVFATFIKVGRKNRFVDNAGQGGNVNIPIDPVTGVSYDPIRFDGWRKVTPISVHPDTGADLINFRIDHFDEILEVVKSFQARISFLKAIGWDIAITPSGPVVIEMNDLWDNTGQYFVGRGWEKDVQRCYDSWKD